MLKSQLLQSLKQKGFSKQILNAFSKVKREDFIPNRLRNIAYNDIALPIGKQQTISQPYTVAIMLSMLELKPGQKVLEIGSGCGYVLALISEIVGNKSAARRIPKGHKTPNCRIKGQVFGIERIKELAKKSKQNVRDYKNIKIYNKNGANGLLEHAPYDRILISAGCKKIPRKVLFQLKDKGMIIAPVDSSQGQSLVALQRDQDKFVVKKEIPGFIFVRFVEE